MNYSLKQRTDPYCLQMSICLYNDSWCIFWQTDRLPSPTPPRPPDCMSWPTCQKNDTLCPDACLTPTIALVLQLCLGRRRANASLSILLLAEWQCKTGAARQPQLEPGETRRCGWHHIKIDEWNTWPQRLHLSAVISAHMRITVFKSFRTVSSWCQHLPLPVISFSTTSE